jgi:hypothetical protein
MTVPLSAERNDYTGDGNTHVYAYSYRITSDSHLLVTVADTDGAETTLTKTTDYTVSGVGVKTGGNVTLVNNSQAWLTAGELKVGYDITVRHVVPLTQLTDVRNQGVYYPETHEDAFDYLMWCVKQQQDEINRSIKMPETYTDETPDYAQLIEDATNSAASSASDAASSASDAASSAILSQAQVSLAADQVALAEAQVTLATEQANLAISQVNTVISGSINFIIDGSSAPIQAGVAGDIYIPFALTLTGYTLLADQSGAIKIDIWKDTYANFPPTDADTITNGHEPEIAASGVKAQDTDIADWSGEAIAAGSTLRINVDSCTSIQKCMLALNFTRTVA